MPNRYANLVGSNKIKDEYTKINTGFDKVEEEIDAHVGAGGNAHATATTSSAGFMSAADKQKLDSVETGAEANQNAFAKVNDLEADDPSDEVTISGGTGITVTTNPNTKEVIVTATGSSTPGPHGSSHTEHGADPIPTATTTEGGLMSAEHVQTLESHATRHEIGGDDEIDLEDLQGSPAALKSHLADSASDPNPPHGMGRAAAQDYEEGTWTPSLVGATTAGEHTYNFRGGFYTRIGNLVHVTGRLSIQTKDTDMSGIVRISGLPFVVRNNANTRGGLGIRQSNIDFPSNFEMVTAGFNEGTNLMNLHVTGRDIAATPISASEIKDGTEVYFSGSYYI